MKTRSTGLVCGVCALTAILSGSGSGARTAQPISLSPPSGSSAPKPEASERHTFGFRGTEFVLDGKPFLMMAGELHFQRIPREYWKDRLLKAKAIGLNTICTYVFWNILEPEPGRWDLTGRNDLSAFINTAQEAGLWVVVRPLQVQNGGPVLMVQIENEYGSYGNDHQYMLALKKMWETAGIEIPFYTADGATPTMLEAGSIPGCAIGLDPGANERHFAEAAKLGRNVPVFCSELYPGRLTHWGEPWAKTKTEEVLEDLGWLLENRKSFNLYVVHGGTNFGFWAGANMGET